MAPRLRTARELAGRYEVSVRTIERDIGALQQAGVPIYADVGRRGGYALEKTMSLPPLNFTPAEAVAIAVALERGQGAPFDRAGRSALDKILAAMPERNASGARELAARVRVLESRETQPAQQIPAVIEQAIEVERVLRLKYQDKVGECTEREVEPSGFLVGERGWYLVAWCRLREGQRVFRLDRIADVAVTDIPMPAGGRPEMTIPAECIVRMVSL